MGTKIRALFAWSLSDVKNNQYANVPGNAIFEKNFLVATKLTRVMKTIFLLIFLIMGTGVSSAQNIESKLIEWMETNSRQEILDRLTQVRQQYADSPAPLFLEAFITSDGEQAITQYKSLVNLYPESRYAEYAIIRIGQFYFLDGAYVSARQWFEIFIERFPKSALLPKARYFLGLSLRNVGEDRQADFELKKIIKEHPENSFAVLAQQELSWRDNQQMSDTEDYPNDAAGEGSRATKYAVQVGAFADQRNAMKIKASLSQRGYPVTVFTKFVNGRNLYLVWLGEFLTKEEATQFGKQFQNQFGGSVRVVKK